MPSPTHPPSHLSTYPPSSDVSTCWLTFLDTSLQRSVLPTEVDMVFRVSQKGFWSLFLDLGALSAIFWHLKAGNFANFEQSQIFHSFGAIFPQVRTKWKKGAFWDTLMVSSVSGMPPNIPLPFFPTMWVKLLEMLSMVKCFQIPPLLSYGIDLWDCLVWQVKLWNNLWSLKIFSGPRWVCQLLTWSQIPLTKTQISWWRHSTLKRLIPVAAAFLYLQVIR